MKTNELGKYLRDLRKSCDYTQEYVASKLNIIHQTYSHYETGRNTPPIDIIYSLAKLYQIPVERLLSLTVPSNTMEENSIGHLYLETADELNAFVEYMKELWKSLPWTCPWALHFGWDREIMHMDILRYILTNIKCKYKCFLMSF